MSFYRYCRRHVQPEAEAGPSGSERLTFVWTKIKMRDLSLQGDDNNRTRQEYNISSPPNRVCLTRQILLRLGFDKHHHITTTTSSPYSNTIIIIIMATIESTTPERQHSPQRQAFTITEAQKQALIDNLQLEGMRCSRSRFNSQPNAHLHTQSPREHVNYAPSMPYKHKVFGRDSTCASIAFPCRSER